MRYSEITDFEDGVVAILSKYTKQLANAAELTEEAFEQNEYIVTLPGVIVDANGESYVYAKMSLFRKPAEDAATTANEKAALANEKAALADEKATLADQKAALANTAAQNANTATAAAQTATNEASNVNAQLVGMTVTITNRNGVATSVNIGFEIAEDHVYGSYAAMVADAANVRAGQFCMIATTDKTSEENAQLYAKNSAGGFTFLSDLDQASSSAWADWMTNKKPLIEQATADANTAASNATSIWNTVKTWFNGTESTDGFKTTAEDWLSSTQSTWNSWFSDSLATGVRKLWNDFWTNINTRWSNFFGEEEGTPTKGVQKTWADWFAGRATDWNSYKDAKDADWTAYKGTKDTDWTAYKDGKDSIWAAWFSDSLATGVRKLWVDFWTMVNADWLGTATTDGLKKEMEDARDHANAEGDRCELLNDHPQEIRSDGYVWAWDENHDNGDGTTGAMVNTLRRIVATLDISSLTEQQRQDLINQFVLNLATTTEAAQIVDNTLVITTDNQDKVITLAALKAYGDLINAALATKQAVLTFASTETCQAIATELS